MKVKAARVRKPSIHGASTAASRDRGCGGRPRDGRLCCCGRQRDGVAERHDRYDHDHDRDDRDDYCSDDDHGPNDDHGPDDDGPYDHSAKAASEEAPAAPNDIHEHRSDHHRRSDDDGADDHDDASAPSEARAAGRPAGHDPEVPALGDRRLRARGRPDHLRLSWLRLHSNAPIGSRCRGGTAGRPARARP